MHRVTEGGETESASSTDITAAEEGVARAGLAFTASLNAASQAGSDAAKQVISSVRPVLIVAGVLVGAVVVVRLVRGPRVAQARGPSAATRSALLGLARTAAISLGAMAARRLAERWLGPDAGRAVGRLSAVLSTGL